MRKILIVLFALLFLFIDGCSSKKMTKNFVKNLQNHDIEKAYLLLAPDSPHRDDKTVFGDFIKSTDITGYHFHSKSFEGGVAIVKGHIIDESNKIDIAFYLVKDKRAWKVLAWEVLENGESQTHEH